MHKSNEKNKTQCIKWCEKFKSLDSLLVKKKLCLCPFKFHPEGLAEVMVIKAASLVPSDRGCSSEWASAPFSFSVLVDFPASVLMPSPSSALCHPVCAAEAVKTVGKRISTRTHSLSLLLLMKLSGVLRWEPLFPTVFLGEFGDCSSLLTSLHSVMSSLLREVSWSQHSFLLRHAKGNFTLAAL